MHRRKVLSRTSVAALFRGVTAPRHEERSVLDRLDPLLKALPEHSRERITTMWRKLPPDVRQDLTLTLKTLELLLKDYPKGVTQLTGLVARQVAPATDPVQDIAVVGPVNVGKSSLYNALVPHDEEKAQVGPVPGTTTEVQTADVGAFRIMDTPGAENWADEKDEELDKAMAAARDANFLLVVYDASRGILTADRTLYKKLAALHKPHVVVLNKIDLIAEKHRAEVIDSAARALGLKPAEILPVSAVTGAGVHQLVLEVAVAEPRLLGHLGTVLPLMRRALAWHVIRRSAVTSTVIALAPIPIIDLLPLSMVQISMILSIARIYGQQMNMKRAGEALGTFGAGILARTLFYELVKLGGIPGWIISASVACSATIGIGYGAVRWFETGERFSDKDLVAAMRHVQQSLLKRLRNFGKKKPDKQTLSQELETVLPAVTRELERDERPPQADS